ncbi:putative F-box domain-containing protein [Rosa chinensis]|uniref:Putative F-box domain-containing protein n=1 Tax=Rosa chinensis TaxID=74649 RepID=A0A2P6PIN6_ROSCH|nr:putative F-box domain-containing protein [Rosa chinensis]
MSHVAIADSVKSPKPQSPPFLTAVCHSQYSSSPFHSNSRSFSLSTSIFRWRFRKPLPSGQEIAARTPSETSLVLSNKLICTLLESFSPRDVARLSCFSSVMYILGNDEPLWLGLCLNTSWKKTVLHLYVSDFKL